MTRKTPTERLHEAMKHIDFLTENCQAHAEAIDMLLNNDLMLSSIGYMAKELAKRYPMIFLELMNDAKEHNKMDESNVEEEPLLGETIMEDPSTILH